jgi:hypothetical protein
MTLHNAQAFLWGDVNRISKTTDNGTTWKVIPCGIGKVTSIKRAANGDIIASGIDSAEKIRAARSKYLNDATYGDNWEVIAAPVPVSSPAIDTSSHFTLTYPARNGVIAFGTTTAGDSGIWMWYVTPPSTSWTRIDKGNPLNQGLSGTNANSSVGTTEEGNGVSYFLDESSIVRLRGRMEFADRIIGPHGVTFTYMMPAFVSPPTPASGPVTLVCLGDNDRDGVSEKIYLYTDTLNRSVTGVAVSAISSNSAIVSWSSLPNATNHVAFVSRNKQTNYYTAVSDAGVSIKYTEGTPTAAVSGLSPDTDYYVNVWANVPVTSFSGHSTFTTLRQPGPDSSK